MSGAVFSAADCDWKLTKQEIVLEYIKDHFRDYFIDYILKMR